MSKDIKYDAIVTLSDGLHDIFDITASSKKEAIVLAEDYIDENIEGGTLYAIKESWG